MTISIIIVDDHPMVREGLTNMLDNCEEITVIGSCGDSREALEKAETLNPEIILMDIKMEGVNGIESARQILARKPDIKIIFLTVFEDAESIRLALQAGASGYILKHVSRQNLIDTIKRVHDGETIIDQSVFKQIVNDYTRLSKKHTEVKSFKKEEDPVELTPREQEILRHLIRGLTNKEISSATNLAVDTVKTHLRNIYRKLQVKNRTQAISMAMKLSRNSEDSLFIIERPTPEDFSDDNRGN